MKYKKVLVGDIVKEVRFSFALCYSSESQKASTKLDVQYRIDYHRYTKIVPIKRKNNLLKDT